MAILSFTELIAAVSDHPDYPRWRKDTPARIALAINFPPSSAGTPAVVDSETFETADGTLLVIDQDREGIVRSIEFY